MAASCSPLCAFSVDGRPLLLHHSALSVPACVSVSSSVSQKKNVSYHLLEMSSWGPALGPGQLQASGQSIDGCLRSGYLEGYRAMRSRLRQALARPLQ